MVFALVNLLLLYNLYTEIIIFRTYKIHLQLHALLYSIYDLFRIFTS